MPHLILLRHAKAETAAPTGRDFDRRLTDRGRRDAAVVARALAALGLAPDQVLVSPALRALETWETAKPAFDPAPTTVSVEPSLYLASVELLARLVSQSADAACLLVVGHNPGLHELALDLAGGDTDSRLASMPTAAAAVFDLAAGGRAKLAQLILARDYGGGAA